MAQRLLIFDLDGTLIDSRKDLAVAVNTVREEYDLQPLAVATVTSYVGNGSRQLMERAMQDCSGADIDEATHRLGVAYRQHLLVHTHLYRGTEEALALVRGLGYRLAVVTNKTQRAAEVIVDGLGVGGFFSAVVGDDGAHALKPEAEPLTRALHQAGCEREGSWMIGDNYTDLVAGRRANVRRCYCRFGFGHARGEASDMQVDSLADFADALARRVRDARAVAASQPAGA